MSKFTKDDETVAKAIADAYKDIDDLATDLTRTFNAIKQDQREILKATDKTVQLNQLQKRLTKELNAAIDSGNTTAQNTLLNKQKELDTSKKLNKAIDKTNRAYGVINDKAKKLVNSAQELVKKLPGGSALVKLFGLDTLQQRFEEGLNTSAEAFLEKMQETGDPVQALKAGVQGFGSAMKAVGVGPLAMIALAVTGIVMLFNKLSKEAHELSTATGLTFGQAKKLATEARAITIESNIQLSNAEDILAVQKETLPIFGNLNMLTTEQAASVAEIGKSFGYGAAQAGKVNNAFLAMGASAGDAANAQRDLAAESLKAGVNVGNVVKDIAENAADVSAYFGGNVKALKNAAVEAAKLGMSIKTMAKVSDSLLSFEESIGAQFELQALTGRQINLDKARELALTGDIAGASKEILNQVGDISEFNKMDVIQRRALAKATGMSVDELQKSLIVQDKLANATDEQRAAALGLGLSATEMAGLSSEELQTRLAQQQAADKSAQTFKAMGETLMNALQPAAESIMEIFAALTPVIKLAFTPIEYAAKGLKMLVELMREYSGVTATVSGLLAAMVINKKIQTALDQRGNAITAAQLIQLKAKAFFENNSIMKALTFESIKKATLALFVAENAQKKVGNMLSLKGIATSLKDAAMNLGGAIAGIFKSFAQIPFGLGVPLAIGAVAGLYGLYKKATSVGDLGIDPGGGPIVMSPQVGGVFQGDRRDGISMGPGMGTSPSAGGGGGGSVAIDYQRFAQIFISALQGVKLQPAPIQIGSQVINEVSNQIDVNKSYK